MILPIVAYGHPVLRSKCFDIDSSYKDLDKLNEKLSEGIRLRDGTIDRLSRSNSFLTGMMSDWKEAQKNNIKNCFSRK